MFSSKNDSAPVPVASVAQPIAPKRPPQAVSLPTIVSSDLVVNGTLTSTGVIQIDGCVDGDVRCVSLGIGDSGQVYGEIVAGDVTIRGQVKGRIRAHKVLLCASSHIEGDILHAVLTVEAGAFFDGACRRSDNQLDEASKKIAEIRPAAVLAVPAAAPADMPVPPMANENSLVSPTFQEALTSG